MNVVAFVSRLVTATSLFVVSFGTTEELCSSDVNKIPEHISVVQATFSPFSMNANKQQVKKVAVADINVSNSLSTNPQEQSVANGPYFHEQWPLNRIKVSRLWQFTSGNPETIVAVLDTGIDKNHEALKNKVVSEVNFTDSPTPYDENGHGTHIAGILVASSSNGKGMSGLAPEIRLMNVKVANDTGICQPAVVAQGIIWAVDNGANIINISLQFAQPSLELEEAINYAWRRGAVVVAAAGNNRGTQLTYPAYYENCIAVAATEQDDTLAPLSNYGDWVDVAAPGFDIYSTLPGNNYGYKSGTSFATAYVSGLAALLFDIATDTNGNGRLNDEITMAIESGCQETDANGMGIGIIDAVGSLSQIGYSAKSIPLSQPTICRSFSVPPKIKWLLGATSAEVIDELKPRRGAVCRRLHSTLDLIASSCGRMTI